MPGPQMSSAPDIQGLEEFSHETDRRLTPFFVGRESEQRDIKRRVARIAARFAAGERKPSEGETVLITGAPGAGKTALMSKLQEMWPPSPGGSVMAVEVGMESLKSAESLFRTLLSRLPEAERGAFGAFWSRAFGINLQALGFGGGFQVGALDTDSKEEPLAGISRPLLLIVDEIQNISPNPLEAECRLLQSLHQGTNGAPIIPVLAGLGNAADVLEKAGISRKSIGATHVLGRLSEGEGAESARRFLEAFGVLGAPGDWPETVEEWSDGWPMHVNNTLRALAAELVRTDGDLTRVDRDEAKRGAFAMRASYYRERSGGALADSVVLLGRVMRRIGRGAPQGMCIRVVREEHEKGNGEEECLPDGVPTRAFFDLAVKKGLLQTPPDDPDMLACPIPSLRSWCMAAAGGPLHTAAMAGDRSAAIRRIKGGWPVDARDVVERTPLHIAANCGWPEIVETLLDADADPRLKDDRGLTPLDCAEDAETRAVIAARMVGAAGFEPTTT